MRDETSERGLSRRDLIKRSAVVGGVVWAAPTLLSGLSSPAAAQTSGCCSGPNVFRMKSENSSCVAGGGGAANCLTGGTSSNCLCNNGVTLSVGANTHTWTLSPGIQFCAGAAKVGEACEDGSCLTDPPFVTTATVDGTTVVTITGSADEGCGLSHSEIIVCANTRPAGC